MNRATIYLAALLHDIGKFWQRADVRMSDSSNLSQESKNLAGYICPKTATNGFGYQHVIWTHQFFQKFSSNIFEKIKDAQTGHLQFRVNPFDGENTQTQDNLVNLAIYHHRPSTKFQALIQLADWWSSGIDRKEDNMETDADTSGTPIHYGQGKFKKVELHSIFPEIQIAGKKQNAKYSYHLGPLNLSDKKCFFPHAVNQESIHDLSNEYSILWEKFCAEMLHLPIDSVEGFTESLVYLLKKYTWCIPSSTRDMANVSLFEHLKSTASFADCLFEYQEKYPENVLFDDKLKRISIKEGCYPVLMLCADISGIQNFIYNVASTKASVSLKGRSFYLQLIIETVIQRVVQETGTTIGHVIYSSGGKFYMVLPNTAETVENLKKIRAELIKEIWSEQNLKLYLCMDWIPFCYQTSGDFKDAKVECDPSEKMTDGTPINSLSNLWKAVSDKASGQKGRKFEQQMLDQYEAFFGENNSGLEIGGKTSVCAVTGEEDLNLLKLDDRDNESIEVLPIVKKQVGLGKILKDADYLLTHKFGSEKGIPALNKNTDNSINPLNQNYQQYLFEQKELMSEGSSWRKVFSADSARIRRINNTDFLSGNQLKGRQVSHGFMFYGGNKQAMVNNFEPKTFYDLARNDQSAPTYLAVLRMDVDGLGMMFQNGIPEHLRTFSSYATLSTALDYFFSGWLNELRDSYPYRDWVNIIYSGGDDLFAVGRWDKIILFAAAIRDKFREFVANREDLSISGGIVFMHEKFPISLAAKQAGEAEHLAKSRRNSLLAERSGANNVPLAKNHITLFGEPISWYYEYDWVKTTRDKIYSLYVAKKITKGFLHKMIDLKLHKDYMIKMQQTDQRVKNDYSYIWNGAYYIARYLQRFKPEKEDDREIRAFLDQLKNSLFDQSIGQDRYFDLIAVAARWTEFHIKEDIII